MERIAILVHSDKARLGKSYLSDCSTRRRDSDNYGHNHPHVSTTLLRETREIDSEDTTRERVTRGLQSLPESLTSSVIWPAPSSPAPPRTGSSRRPAPA